MISYSSRPLYSLIQTPSGIAHIASHGTPHLERQDIKVARDYFSQVH